ncbi:hypothetical protein AB0N17_11720 [Streptomyces sp. NPDC051133]|uniref:hypothetical protein n=1 Tax=Streptomyces sp. NPDC051133 TaxID=3155521 RepID=UPI00342A811B
MNDDQADPAELALVREAFGVDDGGGPALGREAVRAFAAEHGGVLPEPYRTCAAEVTDGSFEEPPTQAGHPHRGHLWMITGEGAALFGSEAGGRGWFGERQPDASSDRLDAPVAEPPVEEPAAADPEPPVPSSLLDGSPRTGGVPRWRTGQ